MKYTYPIEIPLQTLVNDPIRVLTPLNVGELSECSIYFPWGCAGLAFIRILHYETQLYPTNRDEWFYGNELLIKFGCAYEIQEGWNNFKVEGYNESKFYTHTPTVEFVVLPISGLYQQPISWVEG